MTAMRALRLLSALSIAGLLGGCAAFDWFASAPDMRPRSEWADRIVVEKKKRKLELYREQTLIASYDVALGANPTGHKQREGDGKTPEGVYKINARNPDSAFHLSLHISYPNEADRAAAGARGENPGGLIVIHGGSRLIDDHTGQLRLADWTEGCVAVTDDEIEEIWSRVPTGTPIEIRP